MNYPFDIGFASAPGANDFVTFNTLTYAHNPTDGTIDLNVASTARGGLILKSTPPQGKLTFGAEVMFTANNTGTTNHFGLWLLNFPETTNYTGYLFANINNTTAPTGNKWFLTTSNSNLTAWVDFPFRQSDVPAFALNTWYDIRVEYDRKSFATVGTATIKVWVNGVLIGEYKNVAAAAAPVTPGIFLYAGKLKVRRMYGDLTPSVTAETPFSMTEPDRDRMISDFGEGKSATESKPDTQKTWWSNNNDLTIRGRVLTDSFQPIVENVYAFRGDSMEAVHQVETDDEGFYEMTKLDSEFDYVLMVKRDGRMKTIPMADYVGFGELAGAYRIRGENIGEVEVKVFSEQTGEYLGQVKTNVNGQFSIPNVNSDHKFNLVFREPTGAWEDRVSSRRIPELTAFNLQFTSTFVNEGDRINGTLKVKNGHEPYTATAENLKPGVKLIVEGNEISFTNETVMQGPYSIPITVKSIDGGEGVFVAEGVAGYPRVKFDVGNTMTSILEAQIDRDDPYFYSNTKTLLKFDSDMADTSPAGMDWWAGTSTSIDTANKKFGAGSLKFTGAGSIATFGRVGNGLQLGTGDFTLEGWIWIDPSAVSATREIFTPFTSTSTYATFYYQGSSKALQVWKSGAGVLSSNATIVPPSQWVHVAFSRTSGTCRVFQNGTQVASFASTHDFTEDYFCLGGQTTTSSTEAFIGNMDDIRITVGVGRYTANFTPPTKAYPNNK